MAFAVLEYAINVTCTPEVKRTCRSQILRSRIIGQDYRIPGGKINAWTYSKEEFINKARNDEGGFCRVSLFDN